MGASVGSLSGTVKVLQRMANYSFFQKLAGNGLSLVCSCQTVSFLKQGGKKSVVA